ncbi:hypothetical protein [Enterovirga aerilata]|uniref:Uncharacterized protein n=1 Tax=Enterovirga aerilata TaxID=2730920 RepID=A0A849IA77_9HYPH|nr:hypothetical protein [Enterovirga sp. DB1703]NNM74774.1 hypothetical protein [Enterovirga sp. DB1703]
MLDLNTVKSECLAGMLAIGKDTATDPKTRLDAFMAVMHAASFMGDPVLTGDEIAFAPDPAAPTPEDVQARVEEVAEKAGVEVTAPKRRGRKPRAEGTEAKAEGPQPEIRANPEDRREDRAATVTEAIRGAKADEGPNWDDPIEDEPEMPEVPAATKADVVALLNLYSAKHPGKAQAAQAVIRKYGDGLRNVPEEKYGELAAELRAYVEG